MKKTISLILALTLAFSCLSCVAFAADFARNNDNVKMYGPYGNGDPYYLVFEDTKTVIFTKGDLGIIMKDGLHSKGPMNIEKLLEVICYLPILYIYETIVIKTEISRYESQGYTPHEVSNDAMCYDYIEALGLEW